jgi:hypothetical protein
MAAIERKTLTDRSGQQFTIRSAQPDDAETMLAYIRSVAEETEFFVIQPDEFPPTVEAEQAWIQEHVVHPGQLLLLAEVNGTTIGNVTFETGVFRRTSHRGNLGISVDSDPLNAPAPGNIALPFVLVVVLFVLGVGIVKLLRSG